MRRKLARQFAVKQGGTVDRKAGYRINAEHIADALDRSRVKAPSAAISSRFAKKHSFLGFISENKSE